MENDEPRPAHPPSIIVRWEAWVSISTFAICTAIQQNIIPDSATKYAIWILGLIGQVGVIFGRPLLIRGARQTVAIEKGSKDNELR